MRNFFDSIRKPSKKPSAGRRILISALLLAAGLIMGMAVKAMDLYTQNLGNIFSHMSVWIFIGTVIAVYSYSPGRAGSNVLIFCAAMLVSYYLTAHLLKSAYSLPFVFGWSIFSLFSPLFAFFTWYSRGRGAFSVLISCAILLTIAACAVVLFDKLRISDIIIMAATAAVLFIKPHNDRKK